MIYIIPLENVSFLMKGTSVTCVLQNMPNLEVFIFFVSYSLLAASNTCTNCESNAWYYIKFVAFFALQVGLILYTIL